MAEKICGLSYAGYGGCVKPAGHVKANGGHDQFCEDVYGYIFTGKADVRAPLPKGDDGSGNRYPVRVTHCAECKRPLWTPHHRNCSHYRPCDDPEQVPASLQVPTPEPVDYTIPPCGRES